ncbi:DNA methylase [Saccharothrix sp. HUAS TT1]|uniref:DNA methylase n=1 Tax=unclassified Saccharothrix TaxID=2593673 RepID=UPI00345C0DEB
MRLLDLYCGGGGAAAGYIDAGFEVTGVDLKDHSAYYPGNFVQGNALEYVQEHGHEYDAVHASPPCQAYSSITADHDRHPDLVGPTREALFLAGRPWVMENVVGSPVRPDLKLCGSHFDLVSSGYLLKRHRLFELEGFAVPQPKCTCAGRKVAGVYGNLPPERSAFREYGRPDKNRGVKFPLSDAQRVMGVKLPKEVVVQAIPRAYTHYIGKYLMEALSGTS